MTWWAYNADRCGEITTSQAIPLQLPVLYQQSRHPLDHIFHAFVGSQSHAPFVMMHHAVMWYKVYRIWWHVQYIFIRRCIIISQIKPIMSRPVSSPHSPRPRPWTRSHHRRIRPGYLCLNHPVRAPQRTLIVHRHRHRHHYQHCRHHCRHLRTSWTPPMRGPFEGT